MTTRQTVADPYTALSTRATPQTEQADTRQRENAAGGYTFTLDDAGRIERWLILGSDAPTYYTKAEDLTRDNAKVVFRVAEQNPRTLVDKIVEVSEGGRAPKQNTALLALAIASKVPTAPADRRYALEALPRVARTGTALFKFLTYVQQFGGWGPLLVGAVQGWYDDKPVDRLGYQVAKYRQREGWTHRDVFRQAHPKPPQSSVPEGGTVPVNPDPQRDALYRWIAGKDVNPANLPDIVRALLDAQAATTVPGWVDAVTRGASWEMLPDAALVKAEVWEALLNQQMPTGALLRQLPRLTNLGVARSQRAVIAGQLTDPIILKKARIHPVSVLVALKTYASGNSVRGHQAWTPDRAIIDALDAAFYAAYGAVEPSGKRTLIAMDVSGSMTYTPIAGLPLLPAEAAAALALVTANVEPDYDIVGVADTIREIPISPRQRLNDALSVSSGWWGGATDLAKPMQWAWAQRRAYDTMICITDNETWRGAQHPHEALIEYRERIGLPTRLVIVGMTATESTIRDPNDPLALDVVGFDTSVPQLIADFSRG